ncbi:MAG: molybdenum cofactor guanylyltransferase [Nitrospiraceae bacterium]|nr:MAG: molybdenum cofactor guanylyltransferase [Nitrospiraceae bacterium]
MKHTFLKDCTGVILAGGENKRMPVLKGFIEVEGKKIIERNVKTLKQLFKEVFIVTNQPELYVHLGVPLLGDAHNTRGPMTGVFTALLNASHEWIFVSACDMPFIRPALIRYMADERYTPACLDIIKKSSAGSFDAVSGEGIYHAVVPLIHYKAEPLFAFYSNKIMGSLERFVLSGKKSIKDFLLNHDKRVKYITSECIKGADPEARSFINLNTPEDIELYLSPRDRSKFKKSVARRKTCSGLEQRN